MTHTDNERRTDVDLARYLDALDGDDFDALGAIWRRAETDPTLMSALMGLNAELLLDDPITPDEEAPAVAGGRHQTFPDDPVGPSSSRAEEIIADSYNDYRCRVLVVDDEDHMRAVLRHNLAGEFEILEAASMKEAQETFGREPVDILLTDLCLKGPKWQDRSGIELMEWAREHSPRTVCLLMSAYGEEASIIEAINRGQVFHYFPKTTPFPRPELIETLRKASHVFTLERKNRELLERLKDMNAELEEKVRRRTGQLREAMDELAQKNKTLERLALTDALTGLPNRRAMDRLAEREMLWRERNPSPLAIGLVDIDHFKDVNTEYQWSGGDRALTEVSRQLSDSLRDIDYLGRYGGEEFMLIAPQADRHGAEVLAERLRERVEATPIPYMGRTIRVTVSIGVAVAEKDCPADMERMKHACEAALATAKKEGRNRCVIATLPPQPAILSRRARG